jgi:peptidyl-prolyl cis-trans isomerase SurA
MNIKKYIFSCIISFMLCFSVLSKESAYIVYKIDNEIITNIDIEKEYQYLSTLNTQLKDLNKRQVLEVSKESALKEKIKKIELKKYFDIESATIDAGIDIDLYLLNFYQTLGIKNLSEFEIYINDNNLSINYIKEKIRIEILWNQLIYQKYINQVNVNEEKLKKQLKKIINKKENKIYSLSEIVFEKENDITLKKKLDNIKESIVEIGFKNTANIYSISDSSKFGGKIGWLAEEKLSKKIIQELKSLKAGQYTAPILTGGAFLILKIEEIKYEKKLIDENKELKKMIEFETGRQLDQYSKIFYNKIKINNNIDEL